MSKSIIYSELKKHANYPHFDYVDSVEESPRFLHKNHLYIHAKDSLNAVGGECRTELVNNYWMLIYYKLGSFEGCIMDSNWRFVARKFFALMRNANIIKQTLF